ncbi:hypothetical protein [Cylindrospermopsis raciborskii]|uniref:hypothetical protein n=1 Tax=Cylindrospermopsis raciborskii TaxID=77022 RepID=UPI002070626D|nr:hypothetical protein C6N34_016085 [Cylindrospermopsis raciborskii Cr2010]
MLNQLGQVRSSSSKGFPLLSVNPHLIITLGNGVSLLAENFSNNIRVLDMIEDI